jgi:hypothetical protein
MIAEEIRSVAWFLARGVSSKTLNEGQIRKAVDRLLNTAKDAETLEQAVILPESAKLPLNVVAIATKLNRKGVTLGIKPANNDGGAA